MAYCSGRLCAQGIEGQCTSDSAQAWVPRLMAQTTAQLLLLHDGARSHPSKATAQCFAAQADRLTVHPLPSYSPDDHPIAYLWKQTKQRATHHTDCKAFGALMVSGDNALASCATPPETVLGLFGRYGEESGLELKQAA